MSSGVGALLELARALHQADCVPEFTIVIVAFDLEESGSEGSQQFIQAGPVLTQHLSHIIIQSVQEFLLPRLLTRPGSGGSLGLRSQFAGALIMDCLLGHDTGEGSQVSRVMICRDREMFSFSGYGGGLV